MSIDAETFRWIVGGYFVALAAITAVAYHDPVFFISWLYPKQGIILILIYLWLTAFWLGAKSVRDYVLKNLTVPPEQLKAFVKSYDSATDIFMWVVAGSVGAFLWTLVLHSLAKARQEHKVN
ncbi:hypothetical protein [Pseudescherichia sp.]|uniref:hypothetical protein n=1 Tax=Pseudescherichia sp. TaxID=2055881 RepID=UPI0028ADD8D7|nr:hypothetical protein [Pseudescherichia sp.]